MSLDQVYFDYEYMYKWYTSKDLRKEFAKNIEIKNIWKNMLMGFLNPKTWEVIRFIKWAAVNTASPQYGSRNIFVGIKELELLLANACFYVLISYFVMGYPH